MSFADFIDLIERVLNFKLFQFQQSWITISSILILSSVLVVFLLFSNVFSKFFVRGVLRHRHLSEDTTDVLTVVTQCLVMVIGVFVACHSAGIDLSGINQLFYFQIFQIKQTPVTAFSIFLFLLVFFLFLVFSHIFCKLLLVRLTKKLHVEEGTVYTFTRITHYIIMFVGALVAFQFVGIDLSGLVVIFGALSVGIGFGLQNLTSNFISGLIILFERPIKVGDRVTVGDVEGDVTEINIRSTEVRSLNNISVIVPNSEFVSSQVINWSHGDLKVRLDIDVGVSYGSDLDTVLRCLQEVAEEHSEVLQKPTPEALHLGFGDSSWNMRLRVWIAHPKRHPYIRSDINCAIVRKFRTNGVEIPFPQRDLHVRSPLPIPLNTQESRLEPESENRED